MKLSTLERGIRVALDNVTSPPHAYNSSFSLLPTNVIFDAIWYHGECTVPQHGHGEKKKTVIFFAMTTVLQTSRCFVSVDRKSVV